MKVEVKFCLLAEMGHLAILAMRKKTVKAQKAERERDRESRCKFFLLIFIALG
jgi:hypothetical protein